MVRLTSGAQCNLGSLTRPPWLPRFLSSQDCAREQKGSSRFCRCWVLAAVAGIRPPAGSRQRSYGNKERKLAVPGRLQILAIDGHEHASADLEKNLPRELGLAFSTWIGPLAHVNTSSEAPCTHHCSVLGPRGRRRGGVGAPLPARVMRNACGPCPPHPPTRHPTWPASALRRMTGGKLSKSAVFERAWNAELSETSDSDTGDVGLLDMHFASDSELLYSLLDRE